ncbi:MAG: VOC family protein [Anaerolineales bacterium]
MATQYHVNPRFRAYGKARLDIAARAQSREEWEDLWKPPINEFPFEWGRYWKHCVEYRVDDYAAEVGFYIDVLGFPVNAFDPNYAQFTSPDGEFFIAVVPSTPENPATPPDALRLQFMIRNLKFTASELTNRGVTFEQPPTPLQPGSQLMLAVFRSPHGLVVELWGEEKAAAVAAPSQPKPALKISSSAEEAENEFAHRIQTSVQTIRPGSVQPPSSNQDDSASKPERMRLSVLEKLKQTEPDPSDRKPAGSNEPAQEITINNDTHIEAAPMGDTTDPAAHEMIPQVRPETTFPIHPPGPRRRSRPFVKRGSLKNMRIRVLDKRTLLRYRVSS